MTGTYISWHRTYGFIVPDDGSSVEIFFHLADVVDHEFVPKYTKVSFKLAEYKGRVKAIEVCRAVKPSGPAVQS